ncbi:hypothetical protein [Sodalis sp. RH19]|uniref:hypothetical protein n=1 Tax=Sodalis sp. RH19 TaxID=3394334 RepID=UPI0039B4CD7E
MKAYLDTNILRQINKIPETITIELTCSQLGIMELISGMTSEWEYRIRKSSLMNILARDISIVWESPATLQSKAFALNIPDYDVPATKVLMEKIIKTTTLAEAEKIEVDLGGNTYAISTLTQYDTMLMDESVSALSRTLSTSKEDRQSLRANSYTPATIRVYSEMTIVGFLHSLGIEKFTPEYMKAIEHYNNSNPLTNYLYCLTSYVLDAMANGRQPGRNDGHDITHLAYSDGVDLFISDDKIYQRLQQDLFTVKFLRFEEFISLHS